MRNTASAYRNLPATTPPEHFRRSFLSDHLARSRQAFIVRGLDCRRSGKLFQAAPTPLWQDTVFLSRCSRFPRDPLPMRLKRAWSIPLASTRSRSESAIFPSRWILKPHWMPLGPPGVVSWKDSGTCCALRSGKNSGGSDSWVDFDSADVGSGVKELLAVPDIQERYQFLGFSTTRPASRFRSPRCNFEMR